MFAVAAQGPSGVYIGSTFMNYPTVQMTSSNYASVSCVTASKSNLVITKPGTVQLITVTLITNEEIVISDSLI